MIWWIILAGGSGWTVDDFCGTPPRGPWPGPGPWWIRKILALVGGIGAFELIGPRLGEPASILGAVLLGGVGGVVVASIGQALLGGKSAAGN
jgi:hypothetical protein